MRLLALCTCLEVTSNLPQGCAPQNYAILLFAYLLRLPYLVAVHSALSLNGGIVTLIIIARFVGKTFPKKISRISIHVYRNTVPPWLISHNRREKQDKWTVGEKRTKQE